MRTCTCNNPDGSHHWFCPKTAEADIELILATNGAADPDKCWDPDDDDGGLLFVAT